MIILSLCCTIVSIYYMFFLEENRINREEYEKRNKYLMKTTPQIKLRLLSQHMSKFSSNIEIPAWCRITFYRPDSIIPWGTTIWVNPDTASSFYRIYAKIDEQKLNNYVIDGNLAVHVWIIGGFSYKKIIVVNNWPEIDI